MSKHYLGVDVGSISTKGVVLDENDALVAETYLWTEGNPIKAVKNVLRVLKEQTDDKVHISAVGTTGSARELIGKVLNAQVVKNEITAHAIGTLSFHPEVRTIFEIGGQDSKIIILDQGIVVDYAMNTLCAAGTGSFLISQSKRLNVPIEDFGELALKSDNPSKLAGRCTVFAESDLVHKAQMGHSKEDLIAGLCDSVVVNYLNNVAKGKKIYSPIVFQGGVSKNVGVVRSFEKVIKKEIMVDEMGHLMGCIGAAILAKKCGEERGFSFDVKDIDFKTSGYECESCPNNCEIMCIFKDGEFLDGWGNRCPVGMNEATKYFDETAVL